jgi:hypothetical protein
MEQPFIAAALDANPDFVYVRHYSSVGTQILVQLYRTDHQSIYLLGIHVRSLMLLPKLDRDYFCKVFYSVKLDLNSFRSFYPFANLGYNAHLFCTVLENLKNQNLVIDHTIHKRIQCNDYVSLKKCMECNAPIDLEVIPNINRKTLLLWQLWEESDIITFMQWIPEEVLEVVLSIYNA